MISGEISFLRTFDLIVIRGGDLISAPPISSLRVCYFRYNIRREKGLLRDQKTGIVGPNRKQIRYTELADEMVDKLGRLGQKSKKVSGSVFLYIYETLTRVCNSYIMVIPITRDGTITTQKSARVANR